LLGRGHPARGAGKHTRWGSGISQENRARARLPAEPASGDKGAVTPAVELLDVTKAFGRLVANDRVTLSVRPGSIHALVGENGAGKTTLMKVLFGLVQPDSGTIRVRGETVRFRSPLDALRQGLGVVHQHFMLVAPLTVAENIVLGREPKAGLALDRRRAERDVEELSRRYGLRVDPRATIENLSVGEQQRVEILKTLYRGARILILD